MIKDTIWHDEGRGFFTIPAGTEGRLLKTNEFYSPYSEIANAGAISRSNRRYKEQGRNGVWVFLEGKFRFCDSEDCRYVSQEEEY